MFLNCHTAFSFKYGTLSVQNLFDEARRCGVKKLMLTEVNNTASYIELLRICEENRNEYQLDIGVGIEFRSDNKLLYIALAENNAGFENVNYFLSHHNRDAKPLPERAPPIDHVFFIYAFGTIDPAVLRENEFIGIRPFELTKFSAYADRKEQPEKFVILHPVTFGSKTDFNVHRLLRAIDNNTLLSKLQPHQQANASEIMMSESELADLFGQFPDMIANTRSLQSRCTIDFQLGQDKNRKFFTGDLESDWDLLVTRTWEGFRKRYATDDAVIRERVEKELGIIKLKNFCCYYLIAWDLTQFARANNFDYVGRGSGANSVVAFCLAITNVDPVELDLYFERFLNPERSSPPDFDIDFSWDNRDAVYDYLFKTYGYAHVALLGTHTTYQSRSIIRELGKVFGLPKEEIDVLVEEPELNRGKDNITELIIRYAERMLSLPANISIHAGGVVITEKPIYAYTATQMPPKGYPVTHFEMHSAEDIGIFKFDILSQRGLGHLKDTVKHVKQNRGIDVDIHRFREFKDDPLIKDLLRNSKAIGCFYVESPAMRMLLGKLRCEDYLKLVAASSIIRPGVARSGMMRSYIERFHIKKNGGTYESIHPVMDELMADTFGVMVYQEDVIKVAHHFAKLTLSQADVLRRGMSGKFRSRREFDRVREAFFANCKKENYDEAVTNRVWFEIESFAGFSFAKGHSASYAVESYQSLYLKAHYPLEFMVGVINNFGGFYRTEFYFHEAHMNGATVEPPCVNNSDYLTTIKGTSIYTGFVHLKSLEGKLAHQIQAERRRSGDYKSLEDFLNRISPGLEQARILIRLGSFRFTGKTKQRLLWESMLVINNKNTKSTSHELFDTTPADYPLPALHREPHEDAFDEIELLGFPIGDPYRLLKTKDRGDTHAKELNKKLQKQVSIVGYVITTKNTKTSRYELMHFGTFYDEHGDVFDTVHFPPVAKRFPFRGRGFYLLHGKVVEDFGVPTIEVSFMDKLPMVSKRPEENKEYVELREVLAPGQL
jgi:DNA-directed DNA polymerase III PolC